jgi:hypothetical protein
MIAASININTQCCGTKVSPAISQKGTTNTIDMIMMFSRLFSTVSSVVLSLMCIINVVVTSQGTCCWSCPNFVLARLDFLPNKQDDIQKSDYHQLLHCNGMVVSCHLLVPLRAGCCQQVCLSSLATHSSITIDTVMMNDDTL